MGAEMIRVDAPTAAVRSVANPGHRRLVRRSMRVGAADAREEREADRVANEVVGVLDTRRRGPPLDHVFATASTRIQRAADPPSAAIRLRQGGRHSAIRRKFELNQNPPPKY